MTMKFRCVSLKGKNLPEHSLYCKLNLYRTVLMLHFFIQDIRLNNYAKAKEKM